MADDHIDVTINDIPPIAITVNDVPPVAVTVGNADPISIIVNDHDPISVVVNEADPISIVVDGAETTIAHWGTIVGQPTDQADLMALFALKTDKTTTVNGHALSSNVTVTKSDVGLSNVPNTDATNPANISQSSSYRFVTDSEKSTWGGKQDVLVSGTNIKTINGNSLLGSGDMTISSGGTHDHASLTHLDYVSSGHTGFQESLGYTPVPDTRTINGYTLTSNVTLTKSDVGLSNVPNTDATNPANISQSSSYRFVTDSEKSTWGGKQDVLVSGTNIKTINGNSLLGSGDMTISSGGTPGGSPTQVQYNKAGAFEGNSNFTFNETTKDLAVGSVACILSGTITRSSGRISSVALTGGKTITITRSGGRISSITDGSRTWTYTRNGNIQITSWSVA